MKLVRQVVFTAVIPLVGVLLAGLWLLNSAIDNQREQIQQEDELLQQVVQARVDTLLGHIEAASTILADSREAALAVDEHDLNTLHALGRQYEPLQISRIIYLDLDGRVLSRSDDRYRFGDDLSGSEPVRMLLTDGIRAGERVTGLFRQPGGVYYLIARPVLLYREIPVGLVVSSVRLSPQRLQELVMGTGADIEIEVDGELFTSIAGSEAVAPAAIRRAVPMSFAGDSDGLPVQAARLLMHEDRGIHSIDSLARQLLVLFTVLLLVLPLLLMLILRQYLRPYASLVEGLKLLSARGVGLGTVRETLRRDFSAAPEEVRRVAGAVADMTLTLERQMDELEYLAVTDQLTGLANRRFVENAMNAEMARIARHGGRLCVLLVDLDEFKRINDRLGHAAGDEHLRRVAATFRDNCRRSDIVARWGGEEFLLLCPELDLTGARELAQKLRRLVEGDRPAELKSITRSDGVGTLSIGVALWQPGETPEQLVNRADAALYRAKLQGRNRVEVSDEPEGAAVAPSASGPGPGDRQR